MTLEENTLSVSCEGLTSLGMTNILRLQEVKIVGFLLCSSLSMVWPRAKYFFYHFDVKGDIVVLVSLQFASTIVDWESSPS